jgi:thiamine pyrophosphate-dependent acetolactate synthase large subunit-like protein
VSGRVGVLSVHQGPGVTNALTGVTEAAKARTPLIVLAPEATAPRSNFYIDLPAAAAAIGASFLRVGADTAIEDTARAMRMATDGPGSTVILGLPLDVQSVEVPALDPDRPMWTVPAAAPLSLRSSEVAALAEAVMAAKRPVFIAGRGAARSADRSRAALVALAERCGALLAVSAAAKGLFVGDPWYLDISGGFATPLTVELISSSDLIVAWGSTLNMWTTRHGSLIPPAAVTAQVDLVRDALGVNRHVDVGVVGDVAAVADAVAAALDARGGWRGTGWRFPDVGERIATSGRWRDVSYPDLGSESTVDPRTLSIVLDDLLPAERTVVVDSGNFMGYPAMFLSVPDQAGFCFTQAYQSIGLGLASAIGAAVARPDRLTLAALGDGGFLMSAVELVTAVRLGLPLVVVVYNDAAYGAEVHHFGPDGFALDTVRFPDTDLAAIGRGYGCDGVTVRSVQDLAAVQRWLGGPRSAPLVIDAKVSAQRGSWWLEEAFRGH